MTTLQAFFEKDVPGCGAFELDGITIGMNEVFECAAGHINAQAGKVPALAIEPSPYMSVCHPDFEKYIEKYMRELHKQLNAAQTNRERKRIRGLFDQRREAINTTLYRKQYDPDHPVLLHETLDNSCKEARKQGIDIHYAKNGETAFIYGDLKAFITALENEAVETALLSDEIVELRREFDDLQPQPV